MFNPWSCGKCIAKIGIRIKGYDPREMVKDCAWSCLKKGKGGKAFKRCLSKKIKDTIHDVKNPDDVANQIWDEIKNKCSG